MTLEMGGGCEACPAITGSKSDWGFLETSNSSDSSRKRSDSTFGTSGSFSSVPACKATGEGTVAALVVIVDVVVHMVVMMTVLLPTLHSFTAFFPLDCS